MTAPAIEAIDLTRSFGDHRVVDRLSLEVHPGEVRAVVGRNGAGKTSLFRLLLGMLRPDAGRARVLGSDAVTASPPVWRRVGHLVAGPLAYPELSVRDNLAAAARLHGLARREVHGAVVAQVERFELGEWVDCRAAQLSSGNRQRLGLAAALVHGPDVLVLDEPATALDPVGVVLVRELLDELRRAGAAILLSSHHLDELARVADDVTVVHQGRTVGRLDPSGLDLERAFFAMVHDAAAQEVA